MIAVVLLIFGTIALPVSIYFVGLEVIGPYEGEGGPGSLMFTIWHALINGELTAWILVLSPYLVIQLLRLTGLIWRSFKTVNKVTLS